MPADALEAEARAFATRLAALPTVAIGYMKKNLNAAQHGSLSDVMDLEAIHMIRTFMTDECATRYRTNQEVCDVS